jgi:4-amino-4-deoxy-L-arabinose transferase-like glycosyltransferase
MIKHVSVSYGILTIIRNDSITAETTRLYERMIFFIPLILMIALNVFYVLTDTMPPSWDPARHSFNSIKVYDILFDRSSGVIDAWMYYDLYPPIGYIITIPFQMIFGVSYEALVFSIILFWFPITYYFTHKIFREVFNIKDGTETLLNFAFHSNVLLLSFMKQFLTDYPMLTCFVAFSYFLFKSEKFTKAKYCLWAGLASGIGFMTKQSCLVFCAIFFACYLLWIAYDDLLKKHINTQVQFYTRILFFVLGAALFIVPWFSGWSYMFYYEMNGIDAKFGQLENDPYPGSLEYFIWYFYALIYYFTWPGLIILAVGYVTAYLKFENRKLMITFLVSLGIVWVFFTAQWNKDFRFITPIALLFIPEYAGLRYLKPMLSYILIIALLFISVYVNLAQVFPTIATQGVTPYTITHQNSAYVNAPLSLAVAGTAMANRGVTHFELENGKENSEYNSWNRAFYFTMLKSPSIKFHKPLDESLVKKEIFSWQNNKLYGYLDKNDSAQYILFKDSIYTTYYFYKFSKTPKGLAIEQLSHHGKVTGDVKFILDNDINQINDNDTITFLQDVIVPLKDIANVNIRAQIFHNKGRWPLIYRQQFSGEINIHDNLSLKRVNMIPMRSDVTNGIFKFE